MKNIFVECVDIVKELAGNDYLYFSDAVEIKTGPHSYPFQAWAVCASPGNSLFVMDSESQWHQLELTDINAASMIGSLYQRLSMMRVSYAKAS